MYKTIFTFQADFPFSVLVCRLVTDQYVCTASLIIPAYL